MSLSSHLAVITTPSSVWLTENLSQCEERFWVASPFVTGFLHKVVGDLAVSRDCRLFTNMDINNFACRASDIEAVDKLAEIGVSVHSINRLHAKAYVIDEKAALVTSANATHGGMCRNRECGLATKDIGLVREIAEQIESGFGSEDKPQKIPRSELTSLIGVVKQLSLQREKIKLSEFSEEEPLPFVLEGRVNEQKLLEQFSGWTALTFEGVLSLGLTEFTLDQLEAVCIPMAAVKYPVNNNVRAKLRQQLQYLRDFGFVEFLGGRYKLLLERR